MRKVRSAMRPSASRRSRVTPGVSSTNAILRPTRRLNSVDLPTFGRPTMATVTVMRAYSDPASGEGGRLLRDRLGLGGGGGSIRSGGLGSRCFSGRRSGGGRLCSRGFIGDDLVDGGRRSVDSISRRLGGDGALRQQL